MLGSMSRTADPAVRSALLERIVDYVLENGVAGLSLRPLAEAVDSSPRVLLYYFGSKEELIVEVLHAAGERQRAMYARMVSGAPQTSVDVCRTMWNLMASPKSEPVFRLFFEVYGLALQDRERFSSFLKGVVANWLRLLVTLEMEDGASRKSAEAFATMALATFRGLLLDLLATRERKRVDSGFEFWLALVRDAKERAA